MKKLLTLLLCLVASCAYAQLPVSHHVFIVMEENTSYSSIVGSPSMPFLNSLIAKYGLATHYYANTHPSIGNYFMLTTGQIITNDDGYCCTVSVDNAVREMLAAGTTWRSYAESLPAVGYTGGDQYPYVRHHNPFAYFTDVVNSTEKMNLVPFSQFATDLQNGTLPAYSFIVPNMYNDMHDCPLNMSSCTATEKYANADKWLQTNLTPLLNSSYFQPGSDGILIITVDEGSGDNTYGGGRVAWVVVGPTVNPSFSQASTTVYQHQSTLRLMLETLGVGTVPGAGATSPRMTEFFKTQAVPYTVTIFQPVPGSVFYNTKYVVVNASATSPNGVQKMVLWIDSVKAYTTWTNTMSRSQWFSLGQHRIVVQAVDTTGVTWKAPAIYITIN